MSRKTKATIDPKPQLGHNEMRHVKRLTQICQDIRWGKRFRKMQALKITFFETAHFKTVKILSLFY